MFGPAVLGNDSDVDGNPLTAILVSGPSHGTLTLNADGGFTYTPDVNYNGPDSFTYKANDGAATRTSRRSTITVNAVNDVARGRQQHLQHHRGRRARGRRAWRARQRQRRRRQPVVGRSW